MRATAIAVLILLAGCAAPAPGSAIAITSATPASVEVFGRSPVPGAIGAQPAWASDQQIADVAQAHCQQYGKDARKLSQQVVPGARYVLFDCL